MPMNSMSAITLPRISRYIWDITSYGSTMWRRPGSQINPDISDANLKLAPTPATQLQPQFAFHEDSFWVQGFNVGFRLQY